MIARGLALRLAQDGIEAWISRDLVRILACCSEDFVMSSPRIALLEGDSSEILCGEHVIGAYWNRALAAAPDLHLPLLATFAGAHCCALGDRGARGPAAEVHFFDDASQVVRAAASES